jgi:PleD family two-component response regulator
VARILNFTNGEGRITEMHTNRNVGQAAQKVVVVNGSTDVLEMLEMVLDAGRYDMVFVESNDRAYGQIKQVQPNLVILCTRIDQLETFQLLTMLKLDEETKSIPVLTYTTEHEGEDFDTEATVMAPDEEDMLPVRPPIRMN